MSADVSTPGGIPDGAPIVIISERLGPIGQEERRIEDGPAIVRSAALWTHEEITMNAADADVILLGAVEPFDAAALAALPRCKAVVRRGVGHDNVDVDAATRLGIVVANVPDASVEEVSDHALALLVAIERRLIPLDRAVHDGQWLKDPRQIASVRTGIRRFAGLTLGIVGFGRIGRALARKALPLYREILVADPVVDLAVAEQAGTTLVSLDELFDRSDHISLHAPLVPGSKHLVDDAALARLRPGAILVNTSRGGLVDEPALVRAIAEGRLAAAGLDVSEHEPLAQDDPLLEAPGVVLTAHSAASSETAQAELGRRSVDAVIDIVAGRRPASVVNPEVLAAANLRATALARAT